MALEAFAATPALLLAVRSEMGIADVMARFCHRMVALAVAHYVKKGRHCDHSQSARPMGEDQRPTDSLVVREGESTGWVWQRFLIEQEGVKKYEKDGKRVDGEGEHGT